MRFPCKLPISLVVHGRGKSCSRSWQMLLTDVIKSCHGREQVKMPVAEWKYKGMMS